MLQNRLLLDVLEKKTVERPPIWIMRQAGRILPEYREVRASVDGFKALVTNPNLAAEVTIQPVDRLGVDAAIIFSDILVIPEAMGLDYEMIKGKGPHFPKVIERESDVTALDKGDSAADRLGYVYDAIKETKKRLDNRVPLIGFSGAPWTLMCYMIEGQGSKTFSKAKAVLYREPKLAHELLTMLTETIIAYLKRKVRAGVDVVQIFDSWAGVLNKELYSTFCIPYLTMINTALQDVIPTIIFSKGAYFSINDIIDVGSSAVGLDWTIDPKLIRHAKGNDVTLQGNMDPCVLYGQPDTIDKVVDGIHQTFGRNHIFNLGHGVYPDTPLENVMHFVSKVKSLRY